MTTGPTFLSSFLLSIPVSYFFPPSTFASLLSLLLFSFSTFCACLLPAERYPFLFLFSISFLHDLYNSWFVFLNLLPPHYIFHISNHELCTFYNEPLSHTYVFKHIGPLRPFPSASCRDFQNRPQWCKYTFTRYGYANFIYTPFPPPVAAPMSTIPIQPSLWLRYFPFKPLNDPSVVKCHLVAVVPG